MNLFTSVDNYELSTSYDVKLKVGDEITIDYVGIKWRVVVIRITEKDIYAKALHKMFYFYVAASHPLRSRVITMIDVIEKRFPFLCSVTGWLGDTKGYDKGIPDNLAERDWRDVCRCNIFISLIGDNLSHGGKHTELGIAIAERKTIYLVGKPEQVFHKHPAVLVLPNFAALDSELLKWYFKPEKPC